MSKGYGSANLEWNIPNTPSTKFRLGSITKQFTAAAILLLAEQNKLALEDPVKKHWPNAPAAWDTITIFHLLTHTSGIPNNTNDAELSVENARVDARANARARSRQAARLRTRRAHEL